MAATEALNRVKAAKTKLINRVFVSVISIAPHQSLRSVKTAYIALPPLYVLRWRIENAFKALKSDFYIPCASDSSIQVLYFRTVAITLLNEYSYSRVMHYQFTLRQKEVMWPEMVDDYNAQNFQVDAKIDAGLSRTEWKMTLFENEMKNWLQTAIA